MLICPDCHGWYVPCPTCNGIGGVLSPKLGGPVRNGQSRLSGWTKDKLRVWKISRWFASSCTPRPLETENRQKGMNKRESR